MTKNALPPVLAVSPINVPVATSLSSAFWQIITALEYKISNGRVLKIVVLCSRLVTKSVAESLSKHTVFQTLPEILL